VPNELFAPQRSNSANAKLVPQLLQNFPSPVAFKHFGHDIRNQKLRCTQELPYVPFPRAP
jgi:hypothetical protein